jgi:hypothetical protein
MGTVRFSPPAGSSLASQIGSLTIENGIELAQWGYNLNTQTFPTYGGEVIQILSVYIDDLTLGGTVATYSQCEAIYSYFGKYFQIATQGRNTSGVPGQSSYNLDPIIFTYPERGWSFQLTPKSTPGFAYDWDAVGRVWQLQAHIIDESANSSIQSIKDAITTQVIQQGISDFAKLNGEISPDSGNPETNPFQTYDQTAQATTAAVKKYADYYNSLIPAYLQGDFTSLTGGLGSTPSSNVTGGKQGGQSVTVPKSG